MIGHENEPQTSNNREPGLQRLGASAALLLNHPCVCPAATRCSWSVTEHSRCTKPDLFLENMGVLCQVSLIPRPPDGLAEISLELYNSLICFYSLFFPLPPHYLECSIIHFLHISSHCGICFSDDPNSHKSIYQTCCTGDFIFLALWGVRNRRESPGLGPGRSLITETPMAKVRLKTTW